MPTGAWSDDATSERDRDPYAAPFGWWGPVWSAPAPRSVPDLLADGVLDGPTAGVLWALLARRASVVVAAGPSGAGKTTLLTALLDLLPPGLRRVYPRGCYEPFAFLTNPAVVPGRTILLVNEISAHLPIYLWGPGVRRVLEAVGGRDGFALAATAHATSAEAFVGLLTGYPLRLPTAALAGIDAIVLLDAWVDDAGGRVRREVRAVVGLGPAAGGGLALAPLAARPERGAPARLDPAAIGVALARLTPAAADDPAVEVAARGAALTALAAAPPAGGVADALLRLGAAWPRWEPSSPIG